jgi:hypothetical protein
VARDLRDRLEVDPALRQSRDQRPVPAVRGGAGDAGLANVSANVRCWGISGRDADNAIGGIKDTLRGK